MKKITLLLTTALVMMAHYTQASETPVDESPHRLTRCDRSLADMNSSPSDSVKERSSAPLFELFLTVEEDVTSSDEDDFNQKTIIHKDSVQKMKDSKYLTVPLASAAPHGKID